MRKLSADYIFPVSSDPIENGLIVLSDNGEVSEVLKTTDINYPSEGFEKHQGILCPGFVNTHCHLELSFLKGKIPQGKGLPEFLNHVVKLRAAEEEEIQDAIISAEKEMMEAGIVAVGDISNGSHSFAQKAKGNLKYYTFIELLGFNPEMAQIIHQKGIELLNEYQQLENSHHGFVPKASLVPHAPYSVSGKLLDLIGNHCYGNGGVISIHNQENEAENLLYTTGTGKFVDFLNSIGIDTSHWKPSGYNSLPSVMARLPKCNQTLLVHNTFTSEHDIDWVNNYTKMATWCLCPKANLYIEKRLPDINLLRNKGANLTVGTDSLSSNDKLSILEELKTITHYFPNIPLTEIISWGTSNGANLLGYKELGSFEKGKTPGVNHIENVNLKNLCLTEKSSLKKIL